MDLRVLPDVLCVGRLPADAPWPQPGSDRTPFSITRTGNELSIVGTEDSIPAGAKVQPNWRGIEVAGPLDFGLVGVLAGLTATLAEAKVSVFVISTYDTDYILVPAAALDGALAALESSGHQITYL
jgi:hypothetical protein